MDRSLMVLFFTFFFKGPLQRDTQQAQLVEAAKKKKSESSSDLSGQKPPLEKRKSLKDKVKG